MKCHQKKKKNSNIKSWNYYFNTAPTRTRKVDHRKKSCKHHRYSRPLNFADPWASFKAAAARVKEKPTINTGEKLCLTHAPHYVSSSDPNSDSLVAEIVRRDPEIISLSTNTSQNFTSAQYIQETLDVSPKTLSTPVKNEPPSIDDLGSFSHPKTDMVTRQTACSTNALHNVDSTQLLEESPIACTEQGSAPTKNLDSPGFVELGSVSHRKQTIMTSDQAACSNKPSRYHGNGVDLIKGERTSRQCRSKSHLFAQKSVHTLTTEEFRRLSCGVFHAPPSDEESLN